MTSLIPDDDEPTMTNIADWILRNQFSGIALEDEGGARLVGRLPQIDRSGSHRSRPRREGCSVPAGANPGRSVATVNGLRQSIGPPATAHPPIAPPSLPVPRGMPAGNRIPVQGDLRNGKR